MIVAAVLAGFATVLALLLLRGHPGDRRMQASAAAALMLGLGGYAAGSRSSLPPAPARAAAPDPASRAAFEIARENRLTRFGEVGAWLTFADALLRADASATAVEGLRQIIAERPLNADLWIGLGNALAVHGGHVGPAARLAFDQAAMLAPASPQPAFFLGLAQLETGDARGAATTWRTLRRRSLPDADLDARIADADARAAGQS